jgi:hypothetical protein
VFGATPTPAIEVLLEVVIALLLVRFVAVYLEHERLDSTPVSLGIWWIGTMSISAILANPSHELVFSDGDPALLGTIISTLTVGLILSGIVLLLVAELDELAPSLIVFTLANYRW